jgi:DNA-binding transcriptional ArsR family regulator
MDIFSALAVPTRRKIIELLARKGETSATDISDMFDASPPAISQHLKVLREARLVKVAKKGQLRIYQLDMEGMYAFERWTQETTRSWSARFDAIDAVLEIEKKKLLKAKKK